ncbi:glycosyltransferase family 4 protein [Salsipaludibacter albus]|uniref:glycosyltransferase family 4 protein n=1 Tax=Salsipaludibacter albus TaxID=2849650 RepID=UPI001EE4A8A1|nr:glycosyltransferase family 4 protein [Salsipaludibacter albus]
MSPSPTNDDVRRVVVVGPVSPIRSGVANHTTELVNALDERDDVEVRVVSFRRLFPRMLFPGERDRDAGAAPAIAVTPREVLDTLDPVSWDTAATLVIQARPDLVVIPAWTFFVAPALASVARAIRAADIEVVAVVHNAADHDTAAWQQLLVERQLQHADRFVVHSQTMADELVGMGFTQPVTVHPHPVYDFATSDGEPLERRGGLEMLFFGLVRPYKGLDTVAEAIHLLERDDWYLRVVGEWWSPQPELRAQLEDPRVRDRVEIVDAYVPNDVVAQHFERADVVLLPYHEVTGSGVLAQGWHFGTPVVASDLPGLNEYVTPGHTGWTFPAGDSAELARLLDENVTPDAARAMGAAVILRSKSFTFQGFTNPVLGPC